MVKVPAPGVLARVSRRELECRHVAAVAWAAARLRDAQALQGLPNLTADAAPLDAASRRKGTGPPTPLD